MIARLAVRLERAGLFFLETGEDLVGDRFADVELLKARMIGLRIADRGMRIWGCLELLEPAIDLLDACEQ